MTRPAAKATLGTSSGLSSALRLSPFSTCVSRVFHACFARVARVLHYTAFSNASERNRIELSESTAFRVRFFCPVRAAALFILGQNFL